MNFQTFSDLTILGVVKYLNVEPLVAELPADVERRRGTPAEIAESGVAGVVERFAARARRAVRLRGEVNVLVTGSAELRRLNWAFRGKDKPTDVLSFPSGERRLGGDIAISADIARATEGHPLAVERLADQGADPLLLLARSLEDELHVERDDRTGGGEGKEAVGLALREARGGEERRDEVGDVDERDGQRRLLQMQN